MHLSTFLSVFALSGAQAFPGHLFSKRSSATDATLYAYGTNISGLPILYNADNGGLYISATNATIDGLQSITWDIPSITEASTTTCTASMGNGTSPGGMHLNTTESGLTPVSIAPNATSGITLYGTLLVYLSDSDFESKFWAQGAQINGEDAYMVTWNEENASENGMTSLSIKTAAPSS
ncbi:hypothetical protein N0V93_005924 [Gnomoniopsis smithogilvyi]|uniref:Uncharacterized protein n=1 Tax=Gnomoniopsis smithogilvyi TaxID=1191159 RepID=A0A9W9CYH7_9PEZI|nr:hypothetical protein N0V93_005924 [Gnomoniopsis smithogilvyi]